MSNSNFPNRLEDLVQYGYLSTLPRDPFTNENFQYKLSEDGKSITLYSIGKNLTDNNGKMEGEGEKTDDISIMLKIGEK